MLGPASFLGPSLAVAVALGSPPALSPEIGPAPATGLPADNSQHYAMAASNGSGFMVVWQDFRGSDHPSGSRLDAFARVLDPTGIPIGAPTFGRNPTVGSDGQDYLVVWEDYRSDFRGYVYGQRITASGLVLDPGGFQISTFMDQDQVPAVAYGAGHYLVSWADYSSGSLQIWAARVTPTGAVEDPLGIPVSPGPNEYGPTVAFDGQNFLVAWYVGGQVRAARVTPGGVVLDAPYINVTGGLGGQYPAAGFDGQSFLLLFNRNTDIYAARVAPDGGVLDPAAFPVSAGAWREYYPSVACAPSSCAGVWLDGRDAGGYGIYGARIDQSGTVLDDAGVYFMGADSYRPTIAFNGTNYLVSSDQRRSGQAPNVYATLATPSFAPVVPDGTLASTAVAAQFDPQVASGGTEYLMVWSDERNVATAGSDIFAARVGRDGGLMDPSGFLVSGASGDQVLPGATFTGGGYLVTWLDYRDGGGSGAIWAARVDPAGRVVDPNGFPVTPPGPIGPPQITAMGDGGALVVWSDGRNLADSGYDLYFARLGPGAAVLDPGGTPLVIAPGYQVSPAVDGDGTTAVVAWTDLRSGTGSDVYAAGVDALGTVTPSGGLGIAVGSHDEREPAVAMGHSGEALIVWEDNRNAPDTGADLYATRISAGNGIMDPGGFPVCAQPATQRDPAVAFDGAEYLVTWEESRNDRGFFGQTTDIWGTRVTAGGAVRDDGGFPISEDTYDEYSALAASDRQGHILVSYNRPPVDTVDRALARLVTSLALEGAPCGAASRCASGFCVDGVCCDSACGGGDPSDCVACNVEAGAAADGQCTALSSNFVCRPAAGDCDLDERCDGTSAACPPDALRPGGEVCRPVAGDCDVEEICTGQDAVCPADAVASPSTTCRPAAGPCDVPETCSGQSAVCPGDGFAAPGTACGGDGGLCSGAAAQCQVTLQAGCDCGAGPGGLALAAALLLLAAAMRSPGRVRSRAPRRTGRSGWARGAAPPWRR